MRPFVSRKPSVQLHTTYTNYIPRFSGVRGRPARRGEARDGGVSLRRRHRVQRGVAQGAATGLRNAHLPQWCYLRGWVTSLLTCVHACGRRAKDTKRTHFPSLLVCLIPWETGGARPVVGARMRVCAKRVGSFPAGHVEGWGRSRHVFAASTALVVLGTQRF